MTQDTHKILIKQDSQFNTIQCLKLAIALETCTE